MIDAPAIRSHYSRVANLPQRSSLPDQVAAILREGIAAARWSGELPGERRLCEELQVSRDTLRKAVAQLVRERWITPGGRGCHHRIRRQAASRVVSAGRTIRVLSPVLLSSLGSIQTAALEALGERITRDGYRMEFERHPRLFQRHQPTSLQHLTALPDTAGWILFYSPESMQRWFAASRRPCVVAGPLHEGVRLSCVDTNAPAFTTHAVGRLCARGRRELVFLVSATTSLGIRRAAVKFLEEARRLGAHARIVEHGDAVADVNGTMERLLSEHPRPNGLICPHAGHAITVLCHLLGAGVRVPGEVSLIAGWDDDICAYTTPSLARYRIDGMKFGRKLALTMLDQLKHGLGKLRTVQILPEFVPGGTLDEE